MTEKNTLNTELAGRILKLLRLCLNNSRIYPIGSPIVVNNIHQLYAALQDFFSSKESFTISELNHKMIVEGEDIKSLSDSLIISLLTDNEIQSIRFNRGLTLQELSTGIELFSRRREQIKSGPGIIDMLKSRNVKNIVPARVKYVAIAEDEVVKKVFSIVDHLQNDPQAFMTSLREIYDSLDTIKDDNVEKNMTSMLAKKLIAFEPAQLKDFFDRPLPAKIQNSGLQEAVTHALSDEKIKDIFTEITSWYDEIRKNVSSEFEAAEQLASLRRFISKILKSPAARNLPFRFYEELLRVGVLEEIPDFVKKEEPTLIFKVDKLLEGKSSALLDPSVRNELPEIVRQLFHAELEEMVNRLVVKISENLQQTSLKARGDTMKTLLKIFDVAIPFQKEKILKGLETQFLSHIKIESDIDIFRGIADMLSKRMFQLLLRGDYDGAISILGNFKQHITEGVEPDSEKRAVIEDVFNSFAGDVSPLLVNDFKSGVEARQAGAQKIVIMLEDSISGALIQTIKETDDYRVRRTAALMLKNTGAGAVKQFFNSIDLSVSTDMLKKLIDIFDEFLPYDYSEKLLQILDYPDVAVKKLALKHLVKFAPKLPVETLSIIKKAIINRFNDNEIAQDAVRAAGEMRISEAVHDLILLLGSSPLPVQEEACIALAVIGSNDAVTPLIKLLNVKKSFFGRTISAADTVRVHAAWALRNFPGTETEQALNEVLKDKNKSVRSVAAQSLEHLKKPR